MSAAGSENRGSASEVRPSSVSSDAADCADVVLRLFEYVDNEAGGADRALIKEHLEECRSCLREYERDVLLKTLIRRACGCEPAPEALRTEIMTRITRISRGEAPVGYDVTQVTRQVWRREG